MPVPCRRVLFLVALGLLKAPQAFAAEPPTPIPLQAFAALPAIEQPQLSPDGQGAVFIQNVGGKSYVVVSGFGEKPRIVLHNDNEKYVFATLRWAGNRRLLISARFASDGRGVLIGESRLIAVDRDGTALKVDLTNELKASLFQRRSFTPQFQDQIVGEVPGEPESVLIAFDSTQPGQPDVYRLDVRSGRSRLVQQGLGGVRAWLGDTQGEVRLGVGALRSDRLVMVKPPASPERKAEWTTLVRYDGTDAAAARSQALTPLGFDADPRFLYALAPVNGRSALVRIDLQDPTFARETLVADDRFDVRGSLIRDPATRRVVGLDYIAGTSRLRFWDDAALQRQQVLDRLLPGRINRVVSSDAAGVQSIVRSVEASRPAQYLTIDWRSEQLARVGDTQPDLAARPLATPRRIAVRSRDGLTLDGFLTLPPSAAASGADTRPARPLPTILLPHGGPASADTGGYHWLAQFLVSRGWAVLQLNFRGSIGYGQAFREAGRQRWGLEMQDDLADGLKWLVDQGIADAQRVCIVGASYGGYAALMGAVKDPALYRCVASIAGPTDLRDLLGHSQRFRGYELGAEAEIGAWWGDRERLRQTSPALRAAEIRVPVLLIHGANDLTVPVEQSRDMAQALKAANRGDAAYVELPLADHYLSREEDRVRVLTELERFLQRSLSPQDPN